MYIPTHYEVTDKKVTKLRGIVGVEITISEIQCKYKLSQNRSAQDRSNVAAHLKALGSNKLAEAMVRNEV